MTNNEFELALKKACLSENDADIEAAGLSRRHHLRWGPRIIAVAACTAILATGVIAMWPQLELTRTGKYGFTLQVDNNGGEYSPDVTEVEFSYLPNGYEIKEKTIYPDGHMGYVVITNPFSDAELIIEKYTLDYVANYEILRVSDNFPKDKDPVEIVMNDYVVLDNITELTKEVMQTDTTAAYPSDEYYYVVSYAGIDLDDAYNILHGMK